MSPVLLSDLRRELKRRTMLTPLDPIIAVTAQLLDYVGRRLSPPGAWETQVTLANGTVLRLPPSLPSAGKLQSGAFEPEVSKVVAQILKPGMTFVDAGANVGYYTLLAAHLVGDIGHVYAFEPEPTAFEYLEANVNLNGAASTTASRLALSDRDGTAYLDRDDLESGFIVFRKRAGEPVITETMDHFFAGRGWPPVHLVKVDVEGSEARVLAGMRELSRRNPEMQLVMEYNRQGLRRAGTGAAELSQLLGELGFTSACIIEQGRRVPIGRSLPDSRIVYNLLITR